jgi:hypothetical protein
MADINVLAQSAQRKLDNGDATSEVVAIRKAINGAGIFDKNTVAQLMREVGRRFACNKHEAHRVAQAVRRRS